MSQPHSNKRKDPHTTAGAAAARPPEGGDEASIRAAAAAAAVLATPPPVAAAAAAAAAAVNPKKKRRHSSSVDVFAVDGKAAPSAAATTTTATAPRPLEKSTVTTVTRDVTQMNVYDAVLAEASDLAQAASEAQQLGRLKMASSYLLLLHARLVGLGKRFDKMPPPPGVVTTTTAASTPRRDGTTTTDRVLTPNTARVLSRMLPEDIELDQAMMEHLAKAAVELHAARSGRRRHGTEWQAGLTGYDYPQQRQQQQPPSRRQHNEWDVERLSQPQPPPQQQQQQPPLSSADEPSDTAASGVSNTGIVWSLGEIRILQAALENAGTDQPPNAEALARQLGRNPAQVRAFLRNQNTKSRIAADLALEQPQQQQQQPPPPQHQHQQQQSSQSAQQPTATDTPRRKGGRGPKPPTTAIHTVPNAECNASLLLLGGFLPPQEDPERIGRDVDVKHNGREDGDDDRERDDARPQARAASSAASDDQASTQQEL